MSERKKFDPKSFPIPEKDLKDTTLFNKIDIAQTVFRQMERINQASLISEEALASAIRILMVLIPKDRRAELKERSDEYTSTISRYEFKYWCGVPMGTVEHPINGSPFLIEEQNVDWFAVYEICVEIFEDLGITWKTEKWTREAGKIVNEKVTEETETKRPEQ